ncbi:MAG: PTS sugar transporter subunit IIA [Ewingella americana]|jgi:PTS system ascorbate-specific IIA component|uniref:PTS sugar transporter subunit IIA n=1 Tax=Ewingella americana TaxID=41202 RepID=UPI0012AE126E|nr:PTS sugar transporter subunit IIA [Ewingella americana]MCI1677663.1 PTS sugar transporter subunit IIA [Ewingella americana]MCI1852648.1 PTS sugar transporter subunit IIA [Ewingella americana]MCI1861266.1 PTS sugar transporter subunit IIA [Ewingella americana]MCI2143917.1 PTS sugar transporter subunit IIA [Ewingella americana]MCI2162785.1 PTS sugar transporter subunit IIA [Ewingella americana]
MLNDWLTPDTIHIRHDITDWREAVKASAEPLLANGTITADYVEAIFAQHEKLGPYYVLAPGIAMPHARPEEGAKGLGLSLLTLPHGVKFNSEDNDPVYSVVMLAAPDKHSHIELISELAELFSSEDEMQKIFAAKDIKTIQEIISKF